MIDEELVALAQQGDRNAEYEILERYSAFVRSRARRFFLAGGETEDLVQEGCLGLTYAIRDYDGSKNGKSFRNFAYLCVSSQIIDAVKKANAKKNQPLNNGIPVGLLVGQQANQLSPDDIVIAMEEGEEIRRRMRQLLSKFELKIFTMYIDGLSYADICEETGKNIKSIDNAVQRSRKKLREALSN